MVESARSGQPRAVVFWSGGKDSAWALHCARRDGLANPVVLLTTYSEPRGIVPLQEIPLELIQAQADALGLPLLAVPLPEPCPNAAYEQAVLAGLATAQVQYSVSRAVFGDLFLQDIRDWREALLKRSGLKPLFPLWGRDTLELAQEMIGGGLRAQLSCLDPAALPEDWLGRGFNAGLLEDIAELNQKRAVESLSAIDPCGENGEFQTFVHRLPDFRRALLWNIDPRKRALVAGRYRSAGLCAPDEA